MKVWLAILGLLALILLPAQASLYASEEFRLAQIEGVELTRFGGHLTVWTGGVHHGRKD